MENGNGVPARPVRARIAASRVVRILTLRGVGYRLEAVPEPVGT